MRRLLALPVVLLAAALPLTHLLMAQPPVKAEVKPPKRIAVLIGVGEYLNKPFEKLHHTERDVLALRDRLVKAGFQVVMLLGSAEGEVPEGAGMFRGEYEASRANIDAVLLNKTEENKRFAFRNATSEEDQILVAFSGHGEQILIDEDDGDGKKAKREVPHFCPKRAESGKPSTMVSLNEVLRVMGGGQSKALLLVDACRTFAANREGEKGRKGAVVDRTRVDSLRPNVGGMFAASDRQAAREHPDAQAKSGHGLFFEGVLAALDDDKSRDDEGNVVWSRMTDKIGDVVAARSKELYPSLKADEHQVPDPFGRFPKKFVMTSAAAIKAKDGDEVEEKFEWKGKTRTRTVRVLDLGGEKVEFVKVPKGSFQMGSPESDKEAQPDEKPQHKVTFTKDLWVGKYPITKGQFVAFVKADGYKTEAETDGKGGYGYDGKSAYTQDPKYTWKETGWEQTDRHPVVNVTWNDAEAYTKWASKASKAKVRLLTEAEYEYANRGGTDTVYITGDDVASLDGSANVSDKSAKAKFDYFTAAPFDDGYVFTSPVGKFQANGFGLHDTTGNVWSWCADWYDSKLYARGDVTDPKANADGEQKYRVLRGGSWFYFPVICRAASRYIGAPAIRGFSLGFRVCVALD